MRERDAAAQHQGIELDEAVALLVVIADDLGARRQLVAEIDRRDRELEEFRNRRIVKAAEQLNRLRRR